MKIKLIIFFCLLCIACLSCLQEKSLPSGFPFEHAVDTLLENMHARNQFDGTLLVGNKEGILYTKALGTADRNHYVPMETGHRFDIASLNKSFIAALVLMAVEEGKLDLQDRLKDLLKDYSYSGKFDPGITVHQMLSHTSGLPDYDAVPSNLSENNFLKFKRMHFSNEEYIDFISLLPAVNLPGQQFYYSNFGYHLLAIILEDRYDKSFSDLLQEKICQPLGLYQTFAPVSNQEVHPKVAEGYNYNKQKDRWEKNNLIDFSLGRRIYSTSGDLYKWGKAMNDTSLLTKNSLKLMKTNHLSGLTKEFSYGYGWVIFDGNGSYKMGNLPTAKNYIIHGGATEGYKSMLVNIEQGEYIITFLSNTGSQTNEMSLIQKIVQILTQFNHEN